MHHQQYDMVLSKTVVPPSPILYQSLSSFVLVKWPYKSGGCLQSNWRWPTFRGRLLTDFLEFSTCVLDFSGNTQILGNSETHVLCIESW